MLKFQLSFSQNRVFGDRPLQFSTAHIQLRHSVVGHIVATWRIRMNLCFFGLNRVHNSNGISIGLAVFVQMTADCPTLQRNALPLNALSHGGFIYLFIYFITKLRRKIAEHFSTGD